MIDEFINYVSNYDLNNIKIKLKYDHSIRVMNLMIKYAKLIRDTDKIDILYVYGVSDELKVRSENISISKPILNCIKYNKTVSYDLINNKNDELSVSFSYIFDINYDICLKEFLYNLNILYNKLEYKEKFKEIYMLINEYVKDKERVIC